MQGPPEKKSGNTPIFLCAVLIILTDQLSKFFAKSTLLPSQSVPIINGIFHITLVFNKGGAFGLFSGATIFFVFISAVFIFATLFFLRGNGAGRRLNLALSLVAAGAVGNLIDRLRFGFVVDFLDFRIWPVFNIADTAITLGVLWLVWRHLCTRFYLK